MAIAVAKHCIMLVPFMLLIGVFVLIIVFIVFAIKKKRSGEDLGERK